MLTMAEPFPHAFIFRPGKPFICLLAVSRVGLVLRFLSCLCWLWYPYLSPSCLLVSFITDLRVGCGFGCLLNGLLGCLIWYCDELLVRFSSSFNVCPSSVLHLYSIVALKWGPGTLVSISTSEAGYYPDFFLWFLINADPCICLACALIWSAGTDVCWCVKLLDGP
jgi:hypothetical protein